MARKIRTPRTTTVRVLLAVGVVAMLAIMELPAEPQAQPPQGRQHCPEPEAHQFDFLIGEWDMEVTVLNHDGSVKRRAQEKSYVRPMIGGCALIDDWNHKGFTVRMWDPRKEVWRLMWTESGSVRGYMQYWEGGFKDGVGTFIGGDRTPDPRGRIASKIEFSEIQEDSVHWEMFQSQDNGKTWTLTDVREYTRVTPEPQPQQPPRRDPCTEPEAHQFDFLIGEWDMDYTKFNSDGSIQLHLQQKSYVESMNGGCTLIDDWEHYGFTVRMWDPREKIWRFMWTDKGTARGGMQYWEGAFKDGVGTFIGGDRIPNPRGFVASKIVFSDIKENSVHWEMFQSPDNGKTWTLTDVRKFTRAK